MQTILLENRIILVIIGAVPASISWCLDGFVRKEAAMKMKSTLLVAAFGMVSLLILAMSQRGNADDTWSWSNPNPAAPGYNLYALWGTSDTDIYAAGNLGKLIHYNGTSWSAVTSGTLLPLHGLWGTASTDVYAVGGNTAQGTILHYGGGTWVTLVSDAASVLRAVWGSSSTDIYVVGESGLILHSNGAGNDWTVVTSPTAQDLFSIWSSSATNVYAGGAAGNLFRYNGSWNTLAGIFPTAKDIRALWGSFASDIYAAGNDGEILHYNGIAWADVANPATLNLYCLWGSSSTDVFAAGQNGKIYHYYNNGIALDWYDVTPGISTVDINAVWGSTSGKVYFAGDNGTIIVLTRDDHIPPGVVSTSVRETADGKAYATGQELVFNFSEPMDASTLTASFITLKTGSTEVSGTVAATSDRSATFTPNGGLAWSSVYTATVKAGVKDSLGNATTSDYTTTFTTEDQPGSSSSSHGTCFISCARM
jgi:hypothetical protein